ncbi:MAG: M24 family metallopeptidase [Acidimicrobiales bacterium]
MPERSRALRAATYMQTDWFLVTTPDDVRWLTGFSCSTSTALLSAEGEVHLLVDGRYDERARDEARAAGVEVSVHRVKARGDVAGMIAGIVGSAVLGVDPAAVTLAVHDEFASRVRVERTASPCAGPRRVKDAGELQLIARCAAVAGSALETVVAEGLAGDTERGVRLRLDAAMLALGADEVSFPTIVASGPNGARPHHEPSGRTVAKGDLVVIDMGAAIDGYRSDMTRTVRVGPVSPELERMWHVVREAQQAGLDTVRAGVPGKAVNSAVRAVFVAHGVEHEYLHGTGHGVGLVIHEQPILGPACDTELLEGEVVTVEPGLYRGGTGGVRIEDLVVVTGSGCRILTGTPKDLPCPPSAPTT